MYLYIGLTTQVRLKAHLNVGLSMNCAQHTVSSYTLQFDYIYYSDTAVSCYFNKPFKRTLRNSEFHASANGLPKYNSAIRVISIRIILLQNFSFKEETPLESYYKIQKVAERKFQYCHFPKLCD